METYAELVIFGDSELEKGRLWAQTRKQFTKACETRGWSGSDTMTVCIRNHFSVGMARERGCSSSGARSALQTNQGSLASSRLRVSPACFNASIL